MRKNILYSWSLLYFVLSCKAQNMQVETNVDILSKNTKIVPGALADATLNTFEIGAYLPYWGLNNYQDYAYDKINTLYLIATISKATVLESKGLIWSDNDDFPNAYNQPAIADMLAYIRGVNPSIKIILALSDLHSDNTERAQTAELFNNTNRTTTVHYLMNNYVDAFNFDGIDIDFEDESLDPGYIYMNYPLFIKDLATALHNSAARGRRKLCTATLSGNDYTRPIINADFINHIDLVGVQDYGSEKMDFIVANPYRNLKETAEGWASKLPKNKLNLGLSTWSIYVDDSGVFKEGFAFGYNEQLTKRPEALWYLPYLTTDFYHAPDKPSSYMQRYNGLYETRRKAEFAKEGGYKGVFLWEITKDTRGSVYGPYSLLTMLNNWNNNPDNYKKIVGYSTADYYSSSQSITVGFHSLPALENNWVGVYDFLTGQSTGYFQYLPNTSTGNVIIPASLTQQLQANKLYILRFYNGADGIGTVDYGTSNPFYKL